MNAITNFTKTLMETLSKPAPKLFFPSFVNFKGFFARFKEVERKEGFWRAYNKLRMETTFRKGTLVGTDYNGNKYYEDRGAPYGRTRWVEYPTPPGVWAIELKYDGSMVRTHARRPRVFSSRTCLPLRARRTPQPSPPRSPHPRRTRAATRVPLDGQVSPEWHGWLHYMHDKPGPQLVAEFEKPFKQAHTINQTMLRPEFSREGLDTPQPLAIHEPPGTRGISLPRGRIGPKYEAWSGSPTSAATDPELRNFADNQKTLGIP